MQQSQSLAARQPYHLFGSIHPLSYFMLNAPLILVLLIMAEPPGAAAPGLLRQTRLPMVQSRRQDHLQPLIHRLLSTVKRSLYQPMAAPRV